jgi:hypothetical protein
MARIDIETNFVSNEEVETLNAFTLQSIEKRLFENGRASKHLNADGVHMVSRFNKEIEFPQVAFNIRERIMSKYGLQEKDVFKNHNESGIVVNCTFKGGQLWNHTDSSNMPYALLRCNIVTSQPSKGGIFHVDDEPLNISDGDMYCCLVSEHMHNATLNEDDKPRIVWQFGFNVYADKWNKGLNNALS